MCFAALGRPDVGDLIAPAVYLLFPRLVIAGGLVTWYPAEVDVLDAEPMDLFPDSNPDVDHWAHDIEALPFASVEGLYMVLVVGYDKYGRQSMLEGACYRLKFCSRRGLWVPTEWPIQYLNDARGLFFFLSGAMLALAPIVASVLLLASLYAYVPGVVRVWAFTLASCHDFALVLLWRDENGGDMVFLLGVLVHFHAGFDAFFEDIHPLYGEDSPVDSDAFVV